MLAHYFRRYDIRGIVDDNFSPAFAYLLGIAFAHLLVKDKHPLTVLIGRDGRESSPAFAHEIIKGLRSQGIAVTDAGCVATPVVYFGCYHKHTSNAIMITGSHNPIGYNGFKMIVGKRSVTEDELRYLRDQVMHLTAKIHPEAHNAQSLQPLAHYGEIEQEYVQYIQTHLTLKRNYKIVVDAGSGMAGQIAPLLYRALGCEVIELFCTIDGRFPHHHPDPSQPKNMVDLQRAVQENQADIGFAFDGDADRLGVVTKSGVVINADYILAALATHLLKMHAGAPIVFDVKCSQVLVDAIEQAGGVPVMWQTGHSLIKQKMLELKAPIAGELSGHIFFLDRWFGVDDAVYGGARLLEVLDAHDDSDALFASLPFTYNSPELNLSVTEEEKAGVMQLLLDKCEWGDADVQTIDGMRVTFADGWGLVRVSNTTPTLVLRFEAYEKAALIRIVNMFQQQIQVLCPTLNCQSLTQFVDTL